MADIAHLAMATTQPSEPPTEHHHTLVERVQRLARDVSLQRNDLAACCSYSGVSHTLDVTIIPAEHFGPERGGDGSFRARWSRYVRLPPAPGFRRGELALVELTEIVDHLEGLLPQPGGAA